MRKYTKEWLEELCKDSVSYAEVLKKAGRKIAGGNQTHLKKKIEEYGIDVSHFKGQGWSKGLTKQDLPYLDGREKYTLDELFKDNSDISRKVVRQYIIRHNILEYRCNFCGNTGEWLGKTMPLELDHINGKNNDHRIENLRWLCPNCHAITDTYSGRNNKEN